MTLGNNVIKKQIIQKTGGLQKNIFKKVIIVKKEKTWDKSTQGEEYKIY